MMPSTHWGVSRGQSIPLTQVLGMKKWRIPRVCCLASTPDCRIQIPWLNKNRKSHKPGELPSYSAEHMCASRSVYQCGQTSMHDCTHIQRKSSLIHSFTSTELSSIWNVARDKIKFLSTRRSSRFSLGPDSLPPLAEQGTFPFTMVAFVFQKYFGSLLVKTLLHSSTRLFARLGISFLVAKTC